VIHALPTQDRQVIEGSSAGGVVNTREPSPMPASSTCLVRSHVVLQRKLGARCSTARLPVAPSVGNWTGPTTAWRILASQNVDCSYQVVGSHIDYVGTPLQRRDGRSKRRPLTSPHCSLVPTPPADAFAACSKPDRT
jgi:hypothetical protein